MGTSLEKSWVRYVVIAAMALCSNSSFAQDQETDEKSLVGRIAHIEGQLLRHMPEEDDWVLTDVDTPFGEYDNVFSSEDGKAEIILPNNTLVRIGGDTQVQLIELTEEVTELDISSGTARLYNKSSSTEIRATTPFGEVFMPPATACDLFVHETQAELVSLKGSVDFIPSGSTTRHEVIAGSSSIIASAGQVTASAHRVVPAWDSWNADRDAQRAQRMQARGESTKYLPESLQDQAYDLDTNGRWEQVYYDGASRYFWRPSYVSAGWTPFSAGRWIVWHGDHTWVPCEPFGYVTHHYGNWVYAGSGWYWAPPVSAVMVSAGLPLLNVGVGWYPGRVAWVSSGISIGWIPLAPFEMYYCHGYWGPWSRVRHYHHYYDCRKYRHYRHARFVDHHRFYGSRDYRHAGLRKPHHNENFRGTAFVSPKIRNTYKAQNKNLFASNMPGLRDKVKNVDVRGDKRTRHFTSDNSARANPFKREAGKGFENNRRVGKPIVKNASDTAVKNRGLVQKRPAQEQKKLVPDRRENRGNGNRTVQASTGNRTKGVQTPSRSFQQPSNRGAKTRVKAPERVSKPPVFASNRTADSRRTIQAPVPRIRSSAVRSTDSVTQLRSSRNVSVRNSTAGRASVSGRSGNAVSMSRSSNSGSGYTSPRSHTQQRSQMNSAGSMGYSGGRR